MSDELSQKIHEVEWRLDELFKYYSRVGKTKERKAVQYFRYRFSSAIENMPESFEAKVFDVPFGYDTKKDAEKLSTGRVKLLFQRAVFHETENLLRMNLKKDDIALLNRGRSPKCPVGKDGTERRYDISVEHIKDSSLGGSHKPQNLCLMPQYMNSFLGAFVDGQTSLKAGYVVKIVPKPVNGRIPKVPYVPGGFRVDDARDEPRRAAELFKLVPEFILD